jgi:hypothetical protein
MPLLRTSLFILASTAYLVNRFLLTWLELPQYKIAYLNDVLCLPITLTLALFLQQQMFPGSARERLNPAQILFTFLYISFFFEGVLPALADRYTRDWLDVVAYAAGGLIFYYGCNPQSPPAAAKTKGSEPKENHLQPPDHPPPLGNSR